MYLYIDTETTGLKHATGDTMFMCTWAIDDGPVKLFYTDELAKIQSVIKLLENNNVTIVGFNLGFDLAFLSDIGINYNKLYHTLEDVSIMAHIYNNLEPEMDMSSLAKKYTKFDNGSELRLTAWFRDHNISKDNRRYDQVPKEIIEPYATDDILMLRKLHKFYLSKEVNKNQAYKTELDIIVPIKDIVHQGMHIDRVKALQKLDESVTVLTELSDRALREFGVSKFSTVQLANRMFTIDGLKCITYNDKNNITLDEDSLKKYDHPLAELTLEYRAIVKLCNTYLKCIVDKSYHNKLYTSINQVGAKTARMSSEDPNLQNIPRPRNTGINIRELFICEPGTKMLLFDFSQIELRLLAHYAKESAMIEELTKRDGDLHARTALEMFGECNKEYRHVAKTINFATVYGSGPDEIYRQIRLNLPDFPMTREKAVEFKSKYFSAFKNVRQFLWDTQNRVAERGYVFGLSGRQYKCDPAFKYRAANYLIQGESAMFLKRVLKEIYDYLLPKKTRIINIIHDEFILKYYDDEKEVIQDVLNIIESHKEFRVPIFANVEISDSSWSNKRKYK